MTKYPCRLDSSIRNAPITQAEVAAKSRKPPRKGYEKKQEAPPIPDRMVAILHCSSLKAFDGKISMEIGRTGCAQAGMLECLKC